MHNPRYLQFFSSTQHNSVKREIFNDCRLLSQARGHLASKVKLPRISECAYLIVSGFKHLRTISRHFFPFQAQGGKEETHSRPTYQLGMQLPRSLSRAEFLTLMIDEEACKKARNVVITFLLPAKVICTSGCQNLRDLDSFLF